MSTGPRQKRSILFTAIDARVKFINEIINQPKEQQMPVIQHATVLAAPSTRSGVPIRRLVSGESGATQTEVWEQILQPGAEIPLHYHDVEETVVFLGGRIETVIGEEMQVTDAPMTAFVPATLLHSFRNVGSEPAPMVVFFPALRPAVIYLDGERRFAPNAHGADRDAE